MEYFSRVHFIFDDESKSLCYAIEENPFNTQVSCLHIEYFIEHISEIASDVNHIVVSTSRERLSDFLSIAYRYKFSIGVVPMPEHKEQIRNLYAYKNSDENIEVALRDDCKAIDLVEINGELMYSQGIIGRAPLLGRVSRRARSSFFNGLVYAIKEFFTIKLQKLELTTENGKTITTAGSGVVILNHTQSSLLSKIFDFKLSMRDGEITVIIISPYSIFEYIRLLSSIFITSKKKKILPKAIGYIKSKSFTIGAASSKRVFFDNGESIELPITCKIVPDALYINASEEFWLHNEKKSTTKEAVKIDNLPDKNELEKYVSKRIPFLTFASEDRFKELFQILRVDAKVNQTYLFLMILSTLLATVGLFANSTAVIIGAMLVAPLMTPIVSLSMGLLRAESGMIKDSIMKIFIGVSVALVASSLLTYLLPYSELTSEMRSRINPTLLDLGVAIISGVVAAYSKSFKEIMQNLAGVAIAVALVPPLATAGIGLGNGNLLVFFGAFLLFFTNLVGITIAAVMTFQLLGFSNVLKSKKSMAFIFALLIMVSFPLYVSYDKIIQKYQIAKMLKEHRFLVNNKYIIINKATVSFHSDVKVLDLNLLVRESLNRNDLEELKRDLQQLFNTKLHVRAQVEYIL